MQNRSPVTVFLLGLVTFGLYTWYWLVKTKGELNKLGATIPTAWIWLIPFVGTIWWYWKYSEGVEHVTGGKMSGVLSFILLMLISGVAPAIRQDAFNKVTETPASAPTFSATPSQLTPDPNEAPQSPVPPADKK